METPKPIPEDILITEVPKADPSAEPVEAPRFEYPEADAATTAVVTDQAKESQEAFLTGPRRTGNVPLPGGAIARHEITADGMKQTRIVGTRSSGPRFSTAAEFHRVAGVATQAELEVGQSQMRRTRLGRRIGNLLGRS
jgi:hypothetical protein